MSEQQAMAHSLSHCAKELYSLFEKDMKELDKTIQKHMKNDNVPLIEELSSYIFMSQGKRLRPLLLIATHRLFESECNKSIAIAAALEFIHTATLLHDDVVDNSTLRRGKETANFIFGNQSSILVGDLLFTKSFELMLTSNRLEILKILSDVFFKIAEGEVWQLSQVGNLNLTYDTMIQIIERKTASLFRAACELGAMIAHQSEAVVTNLKNYGNSLGILFQLTDDILDYYGDPNCWKKKLGDDLKEKKITLPLMLLYGNVPEEEKKYLERILDANKEDMPSDEDFKEVRRMMDHYDILAKCMEHLQKYVDQTINYAQMIPDHPNKSKFIDLVNACIVRSF